MQRALTPYQQKLRRRLDYLKKRYNALDTINRDKMFKLTACLILACLYYELSI
jgi:hypothetical protein